MKNMLVAQSGGPSAAINATITGVIDAGIASDQVGHVYGARNGIKGVLNENFVNLDEVCDTKEKRDLLSVTPAAALGSCRWKLKDPKENAEHTMLVDLGRNDLSIHGKNTRVTKLKEIHFFSHVIHLVSKVSGKLKENHTFMELVAKTFPAGTLTGAPKVKAMQLIEKIEKTNRSFYGGAIGVLDFEGNFNHAIMIRSFLSKNHTLHFQAGAGIVESSSEENEMQEVYNKLGALQKALDLAENI